MRNIGLVIFLCIGLASCLHAEAIAVWNFNDAVSGVTGGAKEFLVDYGNGVMTSGFSPSNIGNIAGSGLNGQGEDPAGLALRLSSSANNGKDLTWMVSTAGFDSIVVSFSTQRTSTGFNNNQFLYSLDSGNSWTDFGDCFNPLTSFSIHSFDLSGIEGITNNPNAGFRILFGGATASTGNNRIDNLVVSGNASMPPDSTPVPEPSTIALMTAGIGFLFLARVKHQRLRLRACSRH